jgi:hypothetical protein
MYMNLCVRLLDELNRRHIYRGKDCHQLIFSWEFSFFPVCAESNDGLLGLEEFAEGQISLSELPLTPFFRQVVSAAARQDYGPATRGEASAGTLPEQATSRPAFWDGEQALAGEVIEYSNPLSPGGASLPDGPLDQLTERLKIEPGLVLSLEVGAKKVGSARARSGSLYMQGRGIERIWLVLDEAPISEAATTTVSVLEFAA